MKFASEWRQVKSQNGFTTCLAQHRINTRNRLLNVWVVGSTLTMTTR
jgi:hypothetical protein